MQSLPTSPKTSEKRAKWAHSNSIKPGIKKKRHENASFQKIRLRGVLIT
jgi:hypothetical protein